MQLIAGRFMSIPFLDAATRFNLVLLGSKFSFGIVRKYGHMNWAVSSTFPAFVLLIFECATLSHRETNKPALGFFLIQPLVPQIKSP